MLPVYGVLFLILLQLGGCCVCGAEVPIVVNSGANQGPEQRQK